MGLIFDDINDYDRIIVSYSGGKDSTACLLWLYDQGVDMSKVRLWHQCIDGKSDTHVNFFDWPSTEGYVREFAEEFLIPLSWQWRGYGFKGELFKEDSMSNDVYYEFEDYPGKVYHLPTKKGKITTRRKWPAKSGDMNTRWCSSNLKIEVANRVISNYYTDGSAKEPFKLLFITGERREESAKRSTYNEYQPHKTDSKSRTAHHLRPIIDWKEQKVWDIMEKYSVLPHPVYYCGFPRLSCRSCIFFNNNHWATLNDIAPGVTDMLHEVEKELGFTLDNKLSIPEMIQLGKSKIEPEDRQFIKQAVSEWNLPVITGNWQLPKGAFGKDGGAI